MYVQGAAQRLDRTSRDSARPLKIIHDDYRSCSLDSKPVDYSGSFLRPITEVYPIHHPLGLDNGERCRLAPVSRIKLPLNNTLGSMLLRLAHSLTIFPVGNYANTMYNRYNIERSRGNEATRPRRDFLRALSPAPRHRP